MQIQIGQNLIIENDMGTSWKVRAKRVVTDKKSKNLGQEQWDVEGYYGSLE